MFLDEVPLQNLHHTLPRKRNHARAVYPGIVDVREAVDLVAAAALLNGVKLLRSDSQPYPHHPPLGRNLRSNRLAELLLLHAEC